LSCSAIFVAPSAYPLGGVQTWLDSTVIGLCERGWDAKAALVSGRQHNVDRYLEAHAALPHMSVENRTGSWQGRVNAIANAVLAERPDVAVSVNIADTFAGVAQARRRDSSLKTLAVMSIHAIQEDFLDDLGRERSIIDGVVYTNQLVGKLAEARGYPFERLRYAPYGVDLPERWAERRTARLNQLLGAESPIRLAYVGRFDQSQKRILDLAALCDLLVGSGVNFELWIAGAGPDENELRDSLAKHTSDERVRWLGQVAAAEVAQTVYEHVDVLLNPSHWETGPIVIWEAMAHGVAVVSSRYIGSGAEAALVHEANCMLHEIGNMSEAAQCVLRLQNNGYRLQLCQSASVLIRSRYERKRSVDMWKNALAAHIKMGRHDNGSAGNIAFIPHGRLDRWFGAARAEQMRRALGLKFDHSDAGGEWPHSYGNNSSHADFYLEALNLDTA
jgi:glycosyltransferase involved in cell wall biosynthesis